MIAVLRPLASLIARAFHIGPGDTRDAYAREIQASGTAKNGFTKEATLPLLAFRVTPVPAMRLVVASATRDWMLATDQHFANRCLPLLVANQAGWLVLNSHKVRITWTGGVATESLRIEYLSGTPPYPVLSHFGYGIVTWNLPYLFQTPRGYNLLVRGPANWPKDGAYPLEGLVETDWWPATFTMNWKLTRSNEPVIFDFEEPICMLVPQRRHELEAFEPQIRDVAAVPEVRRLYESWRQSRAQFLVDLRVPSSEAAKHLWQKDYLRGVSPEGVNASQHQTKLELRNFKECE